MKPNKTILEQIGITNDIIKTWKDNGLEITFPIQANKKYFKSEDGPIFTESVDKYVPHLSRGETHFFIKFPEKFKDIFLRNANFYFRFHTFLYQQSKAINKLKSTQDKLSASLALIYLFLSATDHHYFHFDRYLAYQDYPETPVGYWWAKLKKYHTKVFKEPVTTKHIPPSFIKLLAKDKDVMLKFKNSLPAKSWGDFMMVLKNIHLFEDAQQKEQSIVSGFPAKDDLLIKTGFGLWENVCILIKKYPSLVQPKYKNTILKLIKEHPILATRKLLLTPQLKMFNNEVYTTFETEIKKWLV